MKSLGGVALEKAILTPTGIKYDREWMLVNETGKFVSQRSYPILATIQVELTELNLVLKNTLGDAGPNIQSTVKVPLNLENDNTLSTSMEVSVWSSHCQGIDQGDEVANWLSQIIQYSNQRDLEDPSRKPPTAEKFVEKVRLVRFDQTKARSVEPELIQPMEATTLFSDGYPFLIVAAASLQVLNEHLALKQVEAIPMNRFRPNIVVSDLDSWQEFNDMDLTDEQGQPLFALRKPCERCIMTTVDQATGEIPVKTEPLKSLVELNPLASMNTAYRKKGAFFGQNAIATFDGEVELKLGDKLVSAF